MPRGVYEHKPHSEETRNKISEAYTETRKGKRSKAMVGKKNANWKGGLIHQNGYVLCLLPKEHRFYCMADSKGYVRMHRLVMAEYLGRPLTDEEIVHHINGDIMDNTIWNLQLFGDKGKHHAYHYQFRKINERGILIC